MEKIIISINNRDAIEVQENNRLAPRYGNSSFQGLAVKEKNVLQQCEQILEEKSLPLLVKKVKSAVDKEDFFLVLEKATALLKQGFHVLIIRAMLECANGSKSGLGYGAFDEKFSRAFADTDFRKALWGTESLTAINVVSALLLEMMNDTP